MRNDKPKLLLLCESFVEAYHWAIQRHLLMGEWLHVASWSKMDSDTFGPIRELKVYYCGHADDELLHNRYLWLLEMGAEELSERQIRIQYGPESREG